MEGSVRDPVCCIATAGGGEKRNLVVTGTWWCESNTLTACHWPETVWALGTTERQALGTDFSTSFHRMLHIIYCLPVSTIKPDINLSNHFHLWRQQKTDQTDHFLCPLEKAISGKSKVEQSAIPGLSTELIITTGYGNNFPALGIGQTQAGGFTNHKIGLFFSQFSMHQQAF